VESPSSSGFLVHEVVIPSRFPIYPMLCECWHIAFQTSSGLEQFQDSLLPCSASVGTSPSKRPPGGNASRIPYSRVVRVLAHRILKVLRMLTITGYLTWKDLYLLSILFLKFKHENVRKMKNKPDPALL
jgi:hypothetical protein